MNTTQFPIDRTSLLNLQRLYDAFIYDRRTATYLKSLSRDFRALQRSPLKREVFMLYDELFRASELTELQVIVRKTNVLMSKLMKKYGDFTHDPEFLRLDPLDETLLLDLIDSIIDRDTNEQIV